MHEARPWDRWPEQDDAVAGKRHDVSESGTDQRLLAPAGQHDEPDAEPRRQIGALGELLPVRPVCAPIASYSPTGSMRSYVSLFGAEGSNPLGDRKCRVR